MDVTAVAAARLWQAIRAAGVLGMPRIRIRAAPQRGAGGFELVVEDTREPGDDVHEFRGIRFYMDGDTARALGGTELDLIGGELIFRPPR